MAEPQGPPAGAPQGPPPHAALPRAHGPHPDRDPLRHARPRAALAGHRHLRLQRDGREVLGFLRRPRRRRARRCSAPWRSSATSTPCSGPSYAPAILGMLWLAPMKLPGRELPDDALWQLDEQVRIQPEDYDRIVEMGWGRVVRPVPRQVPRRGRGGRRPDAGEGAALGRRVHRARLRAVQRLDRRPPVRAPVRRPDDPGVHHGSVHAAGQGRGRDAGHHGREARADPADDPRHRTLRLLGRQLAHRAAVPLARSSGTASCGRT